VAVASIELCPGCALRTTGPSGFCDPCLIERRAEDYGREDHRLAQLRRSQWAKTATHGNQYALLRRQRKRLVDAIRPRRPDPGQDPWMIAKEALLALEHMRGKDPAVLEDVAEALRRLAWGPD
jgi:hypothetical protein